MVDDRKRKPDHLDGALSLASTRDDEGDPAAAAAAKPALNRWTGRRYSPRYYELLEIRRTLPAWQYKEAFRKLLHRNKVLIVVGDGGTGKTTQVPQFALESVFSTGMVACTEPWNVAAMSAAQRVAEEMDVNLGDEVGYCVPFEERSNDKTILKYFTDDMLLREAAADPQLKKYRIVVLDEAHERSLATDMLFAILKAAVHKRTDLKIVIIGARDIREENKFKVFFDNAPIVRLSGYQLHPVEILYTPQLMNNYLDLAIATTVQTHKHQPAGNILVFLPTEQLVDYACLKIDQEFVLSKDEIAPYTIVPLYSDLLPEMKYMVSEPPPVIWKVGVPPSRKIIISTKVAETSIFVDGIVYVIDTGLSNRIVNDPHTGVQTLNVSWISKTSACRRSDLARKSQNGICFRLYTEEIFEEQLSPATFTESLALDLTKTIVTMKKYGVSDLQSLEYIDAPAPQIITRAMGDLLCLGAVNSEGALTIMGRMMSSFPLDPQMAAMLIASPNYKCSNEIVSIAAMLLVQDCFIWPVDMEKAAGIWKANFWHLDGDHLALLKVYNAYVENNRDAQWCGHNFIRAEVMSKAFRVRQELANIMTRLNLRMCSPDSNHQRYYNNIKLAMLSGYFTQVAYRKQGERVDYVTLKDNQVLQIDRTTCLTRKPEFVMYTKLNTGIMRSVTDISGAMLLHVARHYYNLSNIPRCGFKTALEMILLNWLGNSEPRFGYLYDLSPAQIQSSLERLQWETVVPVEQAPEAPGADERGAGFLPPQ